MRLALKRLQNETAIRINSAAADFPEGKTTQPGPTPTTPKKKLNCIFKYSQTQRSGLLVTLNGVTGTDDRTGRKTVINARRGKVYRLFIS